MAKKINLKSPVVLTAVDKIKHEGATFAGVGKQTGTVFVYRQRKRQTNPFAYRNIASIFRARAIRTDAGFVAFDEKFLKQETQKLRLVLSTGGGLIYGGMIPLGSKKDTKRSTADISTQKGLFRLTGYGYYGKKSSKYLTQDRNLINFQELINNDSRGREGGFIRKLFIRKKGGSFNVGDKVKQLDFGSTADMKPYSGWSETRGVKGRKLKTHLPKRRMVHYLLHGWINPPFMMKPRNISPMFLKIFMEAGLTKNFAKKYTEYVVGEGGERPVKVQSGVIVGSREMYYNEPYGKAGRTRRIHYIEFMI